MSNGNHCSFYKSLNLSNVEGFKYEKVWNWAIGFWSVGLFWFSLLADSMGTTNVELQK